MAAVVQEKEALISQGKAGIAGATTALVLPHGKGRNNGSWQSQGVESLYHLISIRVMGSGSGGDAQVANIGGVVWVSISNLEGTW
jgi:hypothetical protein